MACIQTLKFIPPNESLIECRNLLFGNQNCCVKMESYGIFNSDDITELLLWTEICDAQNKVINAMKWWNDVQKDMEKNRNDYLDTWKQFGEKIFSLPAMKL